MGVVVVIETLQHDAVHLLQAGDLLVAAVGALSLRVHEVAEDETAQVLLAALRSKGVGLCELYCIVLYCIVLYCIDRRIYLNLSKSTQSAAGLKSLEPAANGRY